MLTAHRVPDAGAPGPESIARRDPGESAQALASWCYYEGALALPRKAAAASKIVAWEAPSSRYGVRRQAWTPDDDAVVRSHSADDAARILGRTLQSVAMRRWRLGIRVQPRHVPLPPTPSP
nr:hypothetical protein GCM10025730_48280 [Promicromonospora thailandica]